MWARYLSLTLTLNTPFHYDGTSNLLVCFYDPTNGYPGSAYTFRTTSTTDDYPDQFLALTYNSDGQLTIPYDLNATTNGIYFFVVTNKEGTVAKKVVIQR